MINLPTLPGMGGIDVANGVVGAVLGTLCAVLFQQPLQDGWFRLRTRSTRAVRGLRQREESGPAWRTFSIGPLHTSALIVEGDGESSIPAEAVHVRVLDAEIELPSDMDGWRAEIEGAKACHVILTRAAGTRPTCMRWPGAACGRSCPSNPTSTHSSCLPLCWTSTSATGARTSVPG
ncbi:hypothetical protein GCM10010317_014430 [Streptomyces mirabilis]|nr:hypothetical protein GCM10010317_014430 [Streptomyces mirabilis]